MISNKELKKLFPKAELFSIEFWSIFYFLPVYLRWANCASICWLGLFITFRMPWLKTRIYEKGYDRGFASGRDIGYEEGYKKGIREATDYFDSSAKLESEFDTEE